MISHKALELALVAHCKAATTWGDAPIVWPNKNDDFPRPKIVFDLVRVGTTDRTITGSAPVHRGYLMLTVVGELDRFTNETNDLADAIAAHFPYPSTRIAVTGGRIAVIKPPEVLKGLREKDAGEWRVPVRIDYDAQ